MYTVAVGLVALIKPVEIAINFHIYTHCTQMRMKRIKLEHSDTGHDRASSSDGGSSLAGPNTSATPGRSSSEYCIGRRKMRIASNIRNRSSMAANDDKTTKQISKAVLSAIKEETIELSAIKEEPIESFTIKEETCDSCTVTVLPMSQNDGCTDPLNGTIRPTTDERVDRVLLSIDSINRKRLQCLNTELMGKRYHQLQSSSTPNRPESCHSVLPFDTDTCGSSAMSFSSSDDDTALVRTHSRWAITTTGPVEETKPNLIDFNNSQKCNGGRGLNYSEYERILIMKEANKMVNQQVEGSIKLEEPDSSEEKFFDSLSLRSDSPSLVKEANDEDRLVLFKL